MSTLDPCTASALGFAIGHARQAPFEFEPGSTWSYNSFHLQIAGAMAADAAKITTQEMPGVVLRRRGWLVMAGGCPPKFLGMNIMCIILYIYSILMFGCYVETTSQLMPAFLLVSSNFSSNISNSHDGRASSTPSKYPFCEKWYELVCVS